MPTTHREAFVDLVTDRRSPHHVRYMPYRYSDEELTADVERLPWAVFEDTTLLARYDNVDGAGNFCLDLRETN